MSVIWIVAGVVVGIGVAFAVYHNWPKFFGKVADDAAAKADEAIAKTKTAVKKSTKKTG